MQHLCDENVKQSALLTHSPHRRLQQEDERRASPGSLACSVRWTGVSPAGAAAGWPRTGWTLHRPVTDWRASATTRLQRRDNGRTKTSGSLLEKVRPSEWTLVTLMTDTLLTFLSLLLRGRCFCRVPCRPVSVCHVDEPHHCSWGRVQKLGYNQNLNHLKCLKM